MLSISNATKTTVLSAFRSGSNHSLPVRRVLHQRPVASFYSERCVQRHGQSQRFKSTAAHEDPSVEESRSKPQLSTEHAEVIKFPSTDGEGKPVLLNAQEHAVGYLSKILNARVYDAAQETELQHAKNLSAVGFVVVFAEYSTSIDNCLGSE